VYIGDCIVCDKNLYEGDIAIGIAHTDIFYCYNCSNYIQPERTSEKDAKICKPLPDSLNWCDATSVCDVPNTPTKGSESTRNE
jgi:hypothetical protein